MNNYIASKVDFLDLGNDKFEIEGKVYSVDYDRDPQYKDDGVLDISFYPLTINSEDSEYILAFDKLDDVEDPNEWSDEYDTNNYYVLVFN